MDRSRFRMFFHKHLQITSDIIVDRIYRRGSHSSHCSPGSSMTTMWTGSAWKSGSMALAHSWKGSCRRKFFWICHEFWLLLDPIYSLAHICSLIIFARLYQGEGVRKHLSFLPRNRFKCADVLMNFLNRKWGGTDKVLLFRLRHEWGRIHWKVGSGSNE